MLGQRFWGLGVRFRSQSFQCDRAKWQKGNATMRVQGWRRAAIGLIRDNIPFYVVLSSPSHQHLFRAQDNCPTTLAARHSWLTIAQPIAMSAMDLFAAEMT